MSSLTFMCHCSPCCSPTQKYLQPIVFVLGGQYNAISPSFLEYKILPKKGSQYGHFCPLQKMAFIACSARRVGLCENMTPTQLVVLTCPRSVVNSEINKDQGLALHPHLISPFEPWSCTRNASWNCSVEVECPTSGHLDFDNLISITLSLTSH